MDRPEKTCPSCGRRFAWRARWAEHWDDVVYCSKRCRREKPGPRDLELEAIVIELLENRARGATICPSEAARRLDAESWRSYMEATRAAARRLVARGEVEITQRGRVVDPSTARGPIRIRRRERFTPPERVR
ncbi:MAG: DUF2256 and DUF3253 domain-containing protein [Acidobacteriota bacterium]